ncbi:MAG: aminotransferase class V-fold PLP-dependent enzyme, partial [Calditrichaeota bacterium]|nr:aminotransferase class V-fold PLP-dependent enzyme [Calditrichota bacterium]
IIPSASYGINTIAANLDLKQGDQILVMEDQFPSNYYPWYEKAKDCGASLKVVKRPENNDWTTAIINSLDEKVRLAALANVHWTDGTLIDLTKISVVCKQHDILLSADLTQSLGAMPFSVKEADVDFAVAAGYKWLLGPYSLGYMYVKKSHQQMRPLENNWINRAKSDEFSLLVEYTDEFQAGAKRFDVGERSNFFLTPIAAAGLTQILDWGVDTISAYSGDLTSYLATELSGSDIKIADAQFRCPHIIGLYTERVIESVDVLKQANIFVSIRGKSIRVSPHLYNDRADIDRLLEILKQ